MKWGKWKSDKFLVDSEYFSEELRVFLSVKQIITLEILRWDNVNSMQTTNFRNV